MPAVDTYTIAGIEPALRPDLAVQDAGVLVTAAAKTTYPAGTVLGRITTTADEAQTITINGSPTGGSFTLSFRGETTDAIAHDADAAAIDAALEALSTIGAGNVAVTGSGPFTATFGGSLADEDLPLLVADGSSLTGGSDPAVVIAQSAAGRGPDHAYAPYDDNNSDGTQTAVAILMYDTTVDIDGTVQLGDLAATRTDAPVWIGGYFRTEELTGLDANGIADLGRLVKGDLTAGVLRVI